MKKDGGWYSTAYNDGERRNGGCWRERKKEGRKKKDLFALGWDLNARTATFVHVDVFSTLWTRFNMKW